jgi:KUP system potassium uptake protein
VLQGGWIPLAAAALLSFLMLTWRAGRRLLRNRLGQSYLPLEMFLADLDNRPPARVPGTAVFLSGNPSGTPIALLHNLKHNKVLHERVIILTISTQDVPYVKDEERLTVQQVRPDIYRVIGAYGFMEQPDIPQLLALGKSHNLPVHMMKSTFFLSRESIGAGKARDMALWRRRVFGLLSRNAQPATAYFNLPANRVVELGMQVEI